MAFMEGKAQERPRTHDLSFTPILTIYSTIGDHQDTLVAGNDCPYDNLHHSTSDEGFLIKEQKTTRNTKFASPGSCHFFGKASMMSREAPDSEHEAFQHSQVADDRMESKKTKQEHSASSAGCPQVSSMPSTPERFGIADKERIPRTPSKSTDYPALPHSSAFTKKTDLECLGSSIMQNTGLNHHGGSSIIDGTQAIVTHTHSVVKTSVVEDSTHALAARDNLHMKRFDVLGTFDPYTSPETVRDFKRKAKERERHSLGPRLPETPHALTPGAPATTSSYSDENLMLSELPGKGPYIVPPQTKTGSHQSVTSWTNPTSPADQNIVSRIGNTSYSAVPDIGESWPHDSGLSYEERDMAIRGFVEAVEDLARAKTLKYAHPDCSDVIILTEHPVHGKSELRYHREVIVKDSAYLARVIPPPTADGSPVTLYMGSWPVRMIQQVFDFMYDHMILGCKPAFWDMFFHMSPAWFNYHCFLLACAFECKRQQEYHARNMEKIVKVAEKQIRGNYATYELAYWEFSQCEEALRNLVRTTFKETRYQEAQRPMRVLVARLLVVMVPWLLRGRYMGPIIVPLWFEMKEEYLPWREMLWHYIATGEVQRDDWTWLGDEMSELQVTTALSRFGNGF